MQEFIEGIKRQHYWHDDKKIAIQKPDKVVVKKRDMDGNFDKSVIIPTNYYPLNHTEYRVFTAKNTEMVIDEAILSIFDSVKYRIGHCYTNAQELCEKLVAAGYDAKTYCGWLFVSEAEFPIHHCWVVLGNSVLDLSDDYVVCYYMNRSNWTGEETTGEARMKLADFYMATMDWENSKRCIPVGVPAASYFYVGCECEPELGKVIYNQLIRQFPDHECQANCNSRGENLTQEFIRKQIENK